MKTLLYLIALFPIVALAAPVYKTVDQHGNVSYSSIPPEKGESKKITIHAPPSQQQINESQARNQEIYKAEKSVNKNAAQRKAKKQRKKNALARAQKRLDKALQQQEEGLVPQIGERIGGGGRNARYQERQAKLEENVKRAQENFAQIKKTGSAIRQNGAPKAN